MNPDTNKPHRVVWGRPRMSTTLPSLTAAEQFAATLRKRGVRGVFVTPNLRR